MIAMLGWFSEARVWASRVNRARRSGSLANASGRIFSATSRFSFVSRARYTSPMPPAPRAERISYEPRRAPGESVRVGVDYTGPAAVRTGLLAINGDPAVVVLRLSR